MNVRIFMSLSVVALLAAASTGRAEAASASCPAFRAAMIKSTSALKGDFVRPLTVARFGSEKGDVYDFTSSVQVDAVLTCSGDTLDRFEINVSTPASPAVLAGFARLQKVSMTAAFGWTDAHADKAMRTINSEAEEYLKASIQRGDVVLAGKTEYHEGGAGLGMMYTPHRRTFVIVGSD